MLARSLLFQSSIRFSLQCSPQTISFRSSPHRRSRRTRRFCDLHARRHHGMHREVPAAQRNKSSSRALFVSTGGGDGSLPVIFPHVCSLLESCSRDLLTQGPDESLQQRAWGRQFATEQAARQEQHDEQRPQLLPSKSTPTTTASTLKQQSRTSTSSLLQPSPSSSSSPRASPRERRGAASSKSTRRSEWRKQDAA